MLRALCLIFVCLMLSAVGAVPHAYAQPVEGLFGSMEIKSTNMAKFGKWTEMWRRHNLPQTPPGPKPVSGADRCRGLGRGVCGREAWEDFIEREKGTETRALLDAVNAYMNRSPYIVDPVNWGIPDYWATPEEFFLKDGDCEDYAISKFITLKRLGVDPETMRLVILQDENLHAAHAVLAVELDGDFFILDNQVDSVLSHKQILHYRPVYSINETAWWLHRVKRFSG